MDILPVWMDEYNVAGAAMPKVRSGAHGKPNLASYLSLGRMGKNDMMFRHRMAERENSAMDDRVIID